MGSNSHKTVSITYLLNGYPKSTMKINNIYFHNRAQEEAKLT